MFVRNANAAPILLIKIRGYILTGLNIRSIASLTESIQYTRKAADGFSVIGLKLLELCTFDRTGQ